MRTINFASIYFSFCLKKVHNLWKIINGNFCHNQQITAIAIHNDNVKGKGLNNSIVSVLYVTSPV